MFLTTLFSQDGNFTEFPYDENGSGWSDRGGGGGETDAEEETTTRSNFIDV